MAVNKSNLTAAITISGRVSARKKISNTWKTVKKSLVDSVALFPGTRFRSYVNYWARIRWVDQVGFVSRPLIFF